MPAFKAVLRSAGFRALRLLFRALPLGEPTRDRLRQDFSDRFPAWVPRTPRAREGAGRSRRAREQSGTAAIGYRSAHDAPLPTPLPARVIAFYLPQFHPIPENDAWWGTGFTEWRNVAQAVPQFEGHAQPRLPADLGFYDLRVPGVLRTQAALARAHGIEGFCFYTYWFHGRRLLDAPIEQWLASPDLQLPACLCWANEPWTRSWDGRPGDTLVAQQHDDADDLAFIAHVARFMADPRYLRVDGRPLLLVYRPTRLPDAAATARRWRAWCRENGIGEIHLAAVQAFERPDPTALDFDAAVEFPPNLSTPTDLTATQVRINPDYAGQALDWRDVPAAALARPLPPYPTYPGVNCGWDNAPRRPGAGRTFLHASPRRYRDWLARTVTERLAGLAGESRLVFVNAWNEWAEGAVLEPDQRLGHAWLQATRAALVAADPGRAPATPPDGHACAVVHAWYADAFGEILDALRATGHRWRLVVTTAPDRAGAMRVELDARGMRAELETADNRGRDILPFLRAADRLLDEGETCVLKLHTKRSPHRDDGDLWRRQLVDALTAADAAGEALAAFTREPRLGMRVPRGHLQPMDHFLGDNLDHLGYLSTRLGLPRVDPERQAFASGSMFWVRLEALRPLLDGHLEPWEFEAESGQLDGTLAHAIERMFAVAVGAAGYHVEEIGAAMRSPAELAGPAHRRPRPLR
ncbi:MAG TPA: glycoside hydrolase family 99-like domain-containing protein [Luteimonas sp.]|nr:glycoside hydrolase family 99-like domain-containing protein [Luteimonas sp.]